MKELVKESGFLATAQLYIRDAIKMPEVAHGADGLGVWITPMLYAAKDHKRMNESSDFVEQIEKDLNDVAIPMHWCIRVSVHPLTTPTQVGGSMKRFEYRAHFMPLGAMLNDELVEVIKYI